MSAETAAPRPYTADVERGRVFLIDAAGAVICELHWSRPLAQRAATAALLAAGAAMADFAGEVADALRLATEEAETHGLKDSTYHRLLVRTSQRWQAAMLKLATIPDAGASPAIKTKGDEPW